MSVQLFKDAMKKLSATPANVEDKISQFLFRYRITPQATTGIAPAKLLMHRRPKSHLDLLHPSVASRVHDNQERQKRNHDTHAKPRSFQITDPVLVRNTGRGPKWIEGTVKQQTGPVSFLITLKDGRMVRKHIDQLKACLQENSSSDSPPSVTLIISEQDALDEFPSEAVQPTPRHSSRQSRPPVRFS